MKNKKSNLKVLTFVGTRPEVIRLSQTMLLLDKYVNHVVVHTGQNYTYELNKIFIKDLGIRKPDYYLKVNTSTLGSMMGDTLIKAEKVLLKEKPDAVLILGDTNSSIAGIMAKRYKIPIYHMEAGNRCYDQNVPEEINRKIIDHISDFNLVYTEHARRQLLSEGIPHRRIYLTGSPMNEVLKYYEKKITQSAILTKLQLKPHDFFLVSAHREENVDKPESLRLIIKTINNIASEYGKKIIISTHPRTLKRIQEEGNIKFNKNILMLKPFGFTDYVWLQMNAICTLSDSGTISEESAILGFPAITIRNATERPEALDAGSIILTGIDESTIADSIKLVIDETRIRAPQSRPADYGVSNTSWRVLKLILGTAKLSNKWAGIEINRKIKDQ
jgi:UDP-N-acetylglucosamine 2-epimerase (non-hydrolysing)